MTTNILFGIIGLLLLTLGRRLFWLFVAAVGMAAGMEIGQQLIVEPYWLLLLVGLAVGIIGALLALFFQKVAVVAAGLTAGSTATVHLMTILGWPPMPLITLCGAIGGAILLYLLFDWGLIALSSLAGAALITQAWHPAPQGQLILFQVLTVVGLLIQSVLFIKQQQQKKKPTLSP